MRRDHSDRRRRDISDRLRAGARLALEPGFETIAVEVTGEAVEVTGEAVERLRWLTADELDLEFRAIVGPIGWR
jgi:hypothetical protein